MSLFIIPLLATLITHGLKIVLEIVRGSFTWRRLNGYGGMPSSHAAFVTSLCYMMGSYSGWDSPEFAISLVFMIIVIRDAIGFRLQIGIHGEILNKLIKDLPDEEEYKYPVLQEKVGHKISEVIVGSILGVTLSVAMIPLFQ